MELSVSESVFKVWNAYLKTKDKNAKNWRVVIKYTVSDGKIKEWSNSYKMNKLPYVKNSKVVLSEYSRRLKYALVLVDELNLKISKGMFDAEVGDFTAEKIDTPFRNFLKDWLIRKRKDVKPQTFEVYQNKVNVINDYLDVNSKYNITLRQFNTYNEIDSLLQYVKAKNKDSKTSYNYYQGILNDLFKSITIVDKILHPTQLIMHQFRRFPIGRTSKNLAYRNVNQAIQLINVYNENLGALALTMFYTLHRIDTLVKLQFKDFDLDKKLIYVNKDKIKTGNAVTVRIHENLFPLINTFVNNNDVKPDDYFFGSIASNNCFKNVRLFAPYPTKKRLFSDNFRLFKKHKRTDKAIFTDGHGIYSFKHSGINYYKRFFTDKVIIKITGHKNESILKTYSKDFEAIVDEDLWNSIQKETL
ncbi:tyrosine-type recombinase/integrase [Sphingobacterium rhinopitheci]|uniref:tyrosine-type recombinase/integrase n=1 Tax=Sphingobacterium rhinopitheci TaxID=2781960 RepID=UPI001F524B31|nr:tyrosine-type recombinase/integrase [Sphingobacterium rhinopitheci]MCI0922624.1 site-specific integrase [Sphingobacterium rhinopitheci]